MSTPPIDRAVLRAALQGAPAEAKRLASEAFRANGWPTLTPEAEWTPEALYAAATTIAELAAGAGHTIPIPVDTAGLKERIYALPEDLADRAAEEAKVHAIPNVDHAPKWTPELWRLADGIIAAAESHADARRRRIFAALSQAGELADDDRHRVVSALTAGRTNSTRKLTGPEARALAEWAEARSLGTGPEVPAPFAPDWKAEAKALGTTQATLLAEAKAWAKARRLEVPKALSEVTDHRLIAALLHRAGDGITEVVTEAANAVPPALTLVVNNPEPERTEHPVTEAATRAIGELATTISAAIATLEQALAKLTAGAGGTK